MGINFQLYRASVDISKGYRQFQKADSARSKGNLDSAASHLDKGLNCFAAAHDHLLNAEDDACQNAGNEIDKGNKELQDSIDSYSNGQADRAERHYEKAMENYGAALDMFIIE